MFDALKWPFRHLVSAKPDRPQQEGATVRFGGDEEGGPVLIGVVDGPVSAEMSKDALAEAAIPAYIKTNAVGSVYGLSIGSFGSAEIWVPPALADRARETLIGIGVLESSGAEPDSPID